MTAAAKLQTKILTRQATLGEYKVYRAGLEWDLTDPIVIESSDDFKSTPRWRDRLTPYRHQVSNLITFCRRLPVTLLADDVGLGKPGSNQRVEYAIKLPGGEDGDGPLWLPIDAKFPNEDYERLVDASERGDGEAVEASSKAVEMHIRASAKDICDKYVHPPHSTDFGVLFLPTEGLFAEIIRRPGLVDDLQRECRIVVTGPTTLMALLNSLRMGFRTLAIQKRSSEVWQVLAAVKTEFGKYGEVLDKVQQKLHEASNTIEKVSVRRRAIDRRLRDVEVLPEMQVGEILSLPGGNGFNAEDSTEADSPKH